MKAIFKIMFYTIAILFFTWIAVSYMDVLKFQDCGGTDAMWNFFNILFG